jgi:hypothetical protein
MTCVEKQKLKQKFGKLPYTINLQTIFFEISETSSKTKELAVLAAYSNSHCTERI